MVINADMLLWLFQLVTYGKDRSICLDLMAKALDSYVIRGKQLDFHIVLCNVFLAYLVWKVHLALSTRGEFIAISWELAEWTSDVNLYEYHWSSVKVKWLCDACD